MPDPRIHPVTHVLDTFVVVGAVSTLVIAANLRRVELDLVNDGDEPVYVSRGAAAVFGSGLRLNAGGGSYRMGTNNLYHGAIYAICEAGGLNLCISEGSV